MERNYGSPGSTRKKHYVRDQDQRESPQPKKRKRSTASSLVVGATTIAGVGIGLITVIAGTVALGAVTEVVLIPSLLVKLAGGLAGGGVGMSKGLKSLAKSPQE